MTPIRTNKPLFFNSVGEPLNGTIWIGQPDKDPRTNPKTVIFRDAGGSPFAAKQPLNTLNGRIVYNGKPIVALIEGNFSLLSFDSSGAQVEYSKNIEPDGPEAEADGFTQLIRVGLTLAEIKAFDVAVGETIKNVGKVLATDDLGAEWLVISATGNPADDIDLIDFSNGLQGRRLETFVYQKDIVQTGTFIFDSPESLIATTNANSYRNIWTSVDCSAFVPDVAHGAIIRFSLRAEYSASGEDNIKAFIYARKTGSGEAINEQNRVWAQQQYGPTTIRLGVQNVSEVFVPVPVNATSTFDFQLAVLDPLSTSNGSLPDLYISVVGYTVKPETFI